jgi:large-conductance mechanosensitive channel
MVDQQVKAFTSEGADARKWIGRIIMAVILGQAIWNLIVAVMNNLVVPWLGDVMEQSSGFPSSFTQRPYDYPDLFVSVLEFCIAGIVALILNYFFQRQRVGRVKPGESSAPIAPVEPARVVPQAAAAAASIQATPVAPPAPGARPDPGTPPAAVTVTHPAPAAFVTPGPVARSVAVASSAQPVANSVAAKSLLSASKGEPRKLKKPKEVYYNIVGQPVPSDDD